MKQLPPRGDHTRWLEAGLRPRIYNEWKTISIRYGEPVPDGTGERADILFEKLRPRLTGSKLPEKRADWRAIYYALEKAAGIGKACVPFPRNANHPAFKSIRLHIIDAAVIEGIVKEIRSPKGSPKMSRYIPKFKLPERTAFVEVRARKTHKPLRVDWSHPLVVETQHKLTVLNGTNRNWKITIEPWDYWTQEYSERRTIKPVHHAVFTENLDLHGRIYTGRGGHQEHGKEARQTIRFGDIRSVELDYEGFHTRALYHLKGIPYSDDPYELWETTTRKMRLMVKQLINVAINARNRDSTVSACNQAMNSRTPDGKPKRGKEREKAARLREAAKATGLKFSRLYDLAARHHEQIAESFGSDAGIKLMRMDSRIALEILFRFASRGIPCLCVHDSFIVPESEESELRRLMIVLYRKETGFAPVVKR